MTATRRWSILGLVLLVLSALLWLLVPAVPFLPLPIAQRAAIGGAVLVVAEIAFWLGLVAAGPTVAKRWAKWLPPSWWRRLWGTASHEAKTD